MCYPASFIVTKDQVFWSRYTEFHEEIIKEFRLRSTDAQGNTTVVRVNMSPETGDLSEPLETWKYSVSRNTLPSWYSRNTLPSWYDGADVKKRVQEVLPQWRKAKVVGPGEVWETHKDGQVYVFGGTIRTVYENATVEIVTNGGVVEAVYGGRIRYVYNGTVKKIHNKGIIEAVYYKGRIEEVRDGVVEYVCDGGVVDLVYARSGCCKGVVDLVQGGIIKNVDGGVVFRVAPNPNPDWKSTVDVVQNGGIVLTYTPLPDCCTVNDGMVYNYSHLLEP